MGRKLFDLRHNRAIDFLSVDETPDQALEILSTNPGKPVVMSDTTDSPGGGSPGDLTFIFQALLDMGIEGAAIATIGDPIAAGVLYCLAPGTLTVNI